MLREDIPKQLKANGAHCYLGLDESDDEDLGALSESYDIQIGNYFFTKAFQVNHQLLLFFY